MAKGIIAKIVGNDPSSPKTRQKVGNVGSFIGIFGNLCLFILKLIAGILSGSVSITADAFNNLSDMGSSVVTLLGFKLASKPADKEHPFGHGRMEYMSAMLVSVLIIIVGFELFTESLSKLKNPELPDTSLLIFIILSASIVIKLSMGLFNKKLGTAIDSSALKAAAADSFNDCISTGAILAVSVICFAFSDVWFVKYLDPAAGLIVSIIILIAGAKSVKETIDPLIGLAPEKETIENIKQIVEAEPDFLGIHDMIVHNYGPGRSFASLHVEVSASSDVLVCHEKIDACERDIYEKTGVQTVIHMDPIVTDDEVVNYARAEMAKKLGTLYEGLTLHDFRMVKGEKQNNLIFDVCLPHGCNMTHKQVKEAVGALARDIDPTYCCVITVDDDFSGGH